MKSYIKLFALIFAVSLSAAMLLRHHHHRQHRNQCIRTPKLS